MLLITFSCCTCLLATLLIFMFLVTGKRQKSRNEVVQSFCQLHLHLYMCNNEGLLADCTGRLSFHSTV